MADNVVDFMTTPYTFVRVYRLPSKLTDGYCFGGGRPITFTNVDWFEAPIDGGRQGLEAFIRAVLAEIGHSQWQTRPLAGLGRQRFPLTILTEAHRHVP